MNVCRRFIVTAGSIAALVAWCGSAMAEDAGQATLDEATQAKIAAGDNITALGDVMRLCRKALDEGLDANNAKFAKTLLAGALWQRAEYVSGEIFDRPVPARQWPTFRDMAVADLDESLELDPDQAEGQYLYARLQALPGGDQAKAVKAASAAIELTAEQPALKTKALLLRASLAADAGSRRADVDEAIKLAPSSPEVLLAQGRLLLEQGDFAGAIKSFEGAIQANPELADGYDGRGMAYFMSKKYDEAMADYDKAIELAPSSANVYTHRARVKALQEKYTEAITELNNALQLAPNLEVARMLRARVYQRMGLIERAIDDAEAVLRLDPNNSQAVQLHSDLLAGSGQLDRAIEDLESLRKSEPEDNEVLLRLAIYYSADQKAQKAVELFTAAIKKDPENSAAYRGRGDAYLSLAKQRDALSDYELALKYDPESSAVLNNLAWLLATSPDDSLRDGARGIELATLACKLTDYRQAHILSTLAACYAESGDFKTAIDWSSKAVELGADRLKDQLRQELASYQAGKPWREAAPPALAAPADPADAAGQPEGESPQSESNEKSPIGVTERPDGAGSKSPKKVNR